MTNFEQIVGKKLEQRNRQTRFFTRMMNFPTSFHLSRLSYQCVPGELPIVCDMNLLKNICFTQTENKEQQSNNIDAMEPKTALNRKEG